MFFGFVFDGIVDVCYDIVVVVDIDIDFGFNIIANVIAAVQQLCPNIRAGGGGALQW